jgi:pimeloyl-ACP methyl ester carboxylesterase
MKLRAIISIAILLPSLVWAQKSPRLESALTAIESTLPRKTKRALEAYPNAIVLYESVTTPDGKRLRTIITKPRGATKKLPVIFVAGWLSCDSVEAPSDTKDASGLVFRGLAQLPQFVLYRMDKQGVGDSEGVCDETDFDSELAGYRAGFHALGNYDFIDTNRVFILGLSNGGGFAPLIPESDADQQQVRGYISVGGWAKTWFEHMLEIERRRFVLTGKSPAEVTESMKKAATLYHEWLIKGRTVDEITKEQPQLAEVWPGGKDLNHLYGRPLTFYQQLQNLNLAQAWSRVKAPVFALHGEFDWIMSREDHELISAWVSKNGADANAYEVPQMGHTFQHYLDLADAFKGKEAPFDPKVTGLLIDWLKKQGVTRED